MIKVVELFAGVGGFRIGLERNSNFKTVWANQWEPGKKNQFAYDCYARNFGTKEITNIDINEVPLNEIPKHDMLVGGFPCQDYSVAQTKASGIQGKKGVLWWNISSIVNFHSPKYILLENVDRLLKSPSSQRGRDFGVMLFDLNQKGYDVEWRVVNAAEYGMVQKRRRIFIFAWKREDNKFNFDSSRDSLINKSLYSKAFPINNLNDVKYPDISVNMNDYNDLVEVSDNFKFEFRNSGLMIDGEVTSIKPFPKYDGKQKVLKDIIDNNSKDYEILTIEQLEKIRYLKGSKSIKRVSKTGHEYNYSEGQMAFPDALDKPGRTMLTSESTINRSSHFIEYGDKFRKITPIEAERLNGFPDNWTKGMTTRQRFFTMGNALVVDIIEKIANELSKY